MKLTQSQYNELMYWAVQYYVLHERSRSSLVDYQAPYSMFCERFRSIEKGSFGFFYSTEHAKITLKNATSAMCQGDVTEFKSQLSEGLKNHFDLSDCNTNTETLPRPSIMMHTLNVHGVPIGLYAIACGIAFIGLLTLTPVGFAASYILMLAAGVCLSSEMASFFGAVSNLPQENELKGDFGMSLTQME